MNGERSPLPAWLVVALILAVAGVALLLGLETQRWRPGYALGDEGHLVTHLAALRLGGAPQWRWAQGDLAMNLQWLCTLAFGTDLARLHWPVLAAYAAELILLGAVARRWLSAEAAAWAVLADLLSAASWMRARSLLSLAWAPMELLLLAWASAWANSPVAAFAWGAASLALVLDYEGHLIALPGLWLACLAFQPGLRRAWRWALAGGLAAALGLVLSQPAIVLQYAIRRQRVNLGEGPAAVLAAWARNLGQLVVGGEPLPCFSVAHWPAVGLWTLPLLLAGAWAARKGPARALLAWGLGAVLLTQCTLSPYGVAAHRLAAAWPALCLLVGLGAWRLRPRLGRSAWLLGLLLVLGAAAETSAFYRHMALQGEAWWGRSRNLAAAAAFLQGPGPAAGASVDTALYELRCPGLRLQLQPRSGQGEDAWVLLPPDRWADVPGDLRVFGGQGADEPVLLLHARGPLAARMDALERSLRPLLPQSLDPIEARAQALAWLARPNRDEWGSTALRVQDLGRAKDGMPTLPDQVGLLMQSGTRDPLAWVLLSKLYEAEHPDQARMMADHAVALAPDYLPALRRQRELAARPGLDPDPGALVRDRRQGAWMVYE